MYRPRLAVHVIHQQIQAQRKGRSEVGFAAADLGHLLHEIHQADLPLLEPTAESEAGVAAGAKHGEPALPRILRVTISPGRWQRATAGQGREASCRRGL